MNETSPPSAGKALLALLQGGGTVSSGKDGNQCIAAGSDPENEQKPQDVKVLKLRGEADGTEALLGTPGSNTKPKKGKKKNGNREGTSSSTINQTTDSPQVSSDPHNGPVAYAWSSFQSSPDPNTLPLPTFDSDSDTDVGKQLESDVKTMPSEDMAHSLKKVLGMH